MAVYVSNIQIDQSTDFSQVFTLEDGQSNSVLNLTNYTFKSQMRKHPGATSGVTTFTSSIYGNAANGQVKLGLTTSQTANLKDGRYVYDVVLISPNAYRSRAVQGNVLVTPGVS